MTADQIIEFWADHRDKISDASLRNYHIQIVIAWINLTHAHTQEDENEFVLKAKIDGLWKVRYKLDHEIKARAAIAKATGE